MVFRSNFVRRLLLWGATAASALGVWTLVAHLSGVSAPATVLAVRETPDGYGPEQARVRVPQTDFPDQWKAELIPSGVERWVFYVAAGGVKQRVWSFDHRQFDYMKGGNEPLRVLATHFEPGLVIVVLKEHGMTQVAVIKKDAAPPAGSGQWTVAGVQILMEDADLGGGSVRSASIAGQSAEANLVVGLSFDRPGVPSGAGKLALEWSGSTPVWKGPTDKR